MHAKQLPSDDNSSADTASIVISLSAAVQAENYACHLRFTILQKLQFEWEAGDINGRSPKQSDAGNQGVVVTVQKTPVSYSYRLNYIKARK